MQPGQVQQQGSWGVGSIPSQLRHLEVCCLLALPVKPVHARRVGISEVESGPKHAPGMDLTIESLLRLRSTQR